MKATVYLIPTFLDENSLDSLPAYILQHFLLCDTLFVENERTTRRYLKKLQKEIDINLFDWIALDKAEENVVSLFKQKIKEGKQIGIISEAGCPGIADPGQLLVEAAQALDAKVVPLVGPNSILLALMASGMNGQQFSFVGYLPIENNKRIQRIKELELASKKNNTTQIFIETPYRNNQLVTTLLKTCEGNTKLCIAANITGTNEFIKTKTINEWKKEKLVLNKIPAIFLLKR